MPAHQRTVFYQLTVVEYSDESREFRSQVTIMNNGKREACNHIGCKNIQQLEEAIYVHKEFLDEMIAAEKRHEKKQKLKSEIAKRSRPGGHLGNSESHQLTDGDND